MSKVTLYHGDCLEILPTLAAGSVDAVVTDPPYGVNLNYGTAFEDTPDIWLALVPPVVKWADDCDLLCATFGASPTQSRDLAEFHRPPDRTLVWSPAFSLSKSRAHGMFYRWHPIYCWNLAQKHDGPALDILKDSCDGHCWWYHPGTKPLKLMVQLVQMAPKDATILDPFMGSGTTGVACVQTGRNFIGIEISEGYYNIAKARIEKVQAEMVQGRLEAE